jgi:hypothetical protein
MEHRITIARPAEEVFAFLADPAHIRHWLPHLRRDDAALPEGGLDCDAAAKEVRWGFAPAGLWQMSAAGEAAVVVLRLEAHAAPPGDPTGQETARERLEHAALAALQSVKSHVEGVDGGDPAEPTVDSPSRLFGHSATQEPKI